MKRSWLGTCLLGLSICLAKPVLAVEFGEMVEKDSAWVFQLTDDPALTLMLKKGVISEEDYALAAAAVEKSRQNAAPAFKVGYKKGFFIQGDKFGLTIRARLQFRYTHDEFNSLYGTVGDTQNFGSAANPVRRTEDVDMFSVRRARLVFSGYAFSPQTT